MSHCSAWQSDPLVNPSTGLPISKSGAVYKAYSDMCANDEALLAKWVRNKEVNPITNRRITAQGSVYRMFEDMHLARRAQQRRRSASPRAPAKSVHISPSYCAKWSADKSRNPITGRAISPSGDVYRRFAKACEGVSMPARGRSPKIAQSDPRFCGAWETSKPINPATGRKLEHGSNQYKSLEKKCSGEPRTRRASSPRARRASETKVRFQKIKQADPRFCSAWEADKPINPATGRKVEPGSNQYKRFEKKCSGKPKAPRAAVKKVYPSVSMISSSSGSSSGSSRSPSVSRRRSRSPSVSRSRSRSPSVSRSRSRSPSVSRRRSRSPSVSRSRSRSPLRRSPAARSPVPRKSRSPVRRSRAVRGSPVKRTALVKPRMPQVDDEGFWRGGARASDWDDDLRYSVMEM